MVHDLYRLSNALTRSISAENPTGGKGMGGMAGPECYEPSRELGRGWKCRPFERIQPGTTAVLADIKGPGMIQSIRMASFPPRDSVLRIYWDDQESPSVETPTGDFFAAPFASVKMGKGQSSLMLLNSQMVCINPNKGMSCFWEMPFRKRCLITMENLHPQNEITLYYQVNYALTEVPEDAAYFHVQFRRTNPLPYGEVYTILDNVAGKGQYVGTAMGVSVHNNGWWGEGEIKFYLDGDRDFPTICGTGTEDYFLGSYNWDVDGEYIPYSTPYAGMYHVIKPDGLYNAVQRHSMYRWHVVDPIRFEKDIRVTIQALGWRSEGRLYPGMHDICSTAYWYQALPTPAFPKLPDRNGLEMI